MRPTIWALGLACVCGTALAAPAPRHTVVSIDGERFLIDGRPTYAGRTWQGRKIEGLLMNARLVQGIFDDANPETAARWAYPDTGRWDAERNVREFLAAMPEWRRHGLLSFTLCLQGGSPEGYSSAQPWIVGAFAPDGRLIPAYMERLRRILDLADELGMAPIVSYFYFAQDQRLKDEAAVLRATDQATRWLLEGGWRNVLVEVNNECDGPYDHEVLRPARVRELIERVQKTTRDGRRLLVSTSYMGGVLPDSGVVRVADFVLLHGNGVSDPAAITAMVRRTRAISGYAPKPILFNEDDHYDFEKPVNNFVAATQAYASWGFFDYRHKGESYDQGYQSVPVNWRISSARKRGFFDLLADITGARPQPSTGAVEGGTQAPRVGLLGNQPWLGR